MARKSSKTAHVLNLLTTGSAHDDLVQDIEQQDEEISVAKLIQKQPAAKKVQPKKSSPQKAAIEPKEAAEVIIEQEPEPPMPEPETSTAQPEPAYTAPPEPVQPAPQPVTATAPAAPAVAQVEAAPPAPQPEPEARRTVDDDLYELVNIAELAIKEKVTSVTERMNLCDCIKCRQDVIAFALNLLPSRYLPQNRAGSLEIDRYLSEHGREVTAALVKACIKVKASPRH